MPYSLKLKPHLDKIFKKIGKRDPSQLEAIHKKIKQILENPYRFKPLKAPMQNVWRVHTYSSFVIIYKILENEKTVEILDYAHHDDIYN